MMKFKKWFFFFFFKHLKYLANRKTSDKNVSQQSFFFFLLFLLLEWKYVRRWTEAWRNVHTMFLIIDEIEHSQFFWIHTTFQYLRYGKRKWFELYLSLMDFQFPDLFFLWVILPFSRSWPFGAKILSTNQSSFLLPPPCRITPLALWKSTSSLFVAVFWQFLPSNAPIMLYNICYWWFFLFQSNRWIKYLAYKIQWSKPCLLMFASLIALDGFHLLLST